ncbi:MAG: hypothetical protein IPK52_24785 [Chloroflexi bacterium]|nr:hypothetical protein [Chloroflexota bacterium]
MTSSKKDHKTQLLDFIMTQPLDDDCVSMDCTDDCEQISRLAERVASGERLEDIAPDFQQFVGHWSDCREEFEALVAILKAERAQIDGHE